MITMREANEECERLMKINAALVEALQAMVDARNRKPYSPNQATVAWIKADAALKLAKGE